MIKENVSRIRQRILKVCSKINQDPGKITIIAISKGRALEQIKEAVDAGINDIGENRVQEAILRYNNLTPNTQHPTPIKCHMVGHLQTNKVKDAVRIFDLIQSVDSVRLAEEIDKQADKINKIQDILIEIKTSPEESKFGLKADEAIEVMPELIKFRNINIKGLMTIAPIVDNPEKSRPYFRILRELRDRINSLNAKRYTLYALSMGMTDDFEIAIEEGSNMVRLGRAIFE
jgi:pyridoxal phosphate enzyme (YggS family)